MADNFGLKIGIEGEKEFKKALSEINQSFKVLGSEMKLVSSQFDSNDKSIQALSARNTVLNKEIDAQRQKIETLRAALQNASESFGENDRRTQNWQIQLNNAEAALNGMERELSANERAIESLSRQETEAADATERLSQEISRQEEELSGMKRAYSNAVLEYGKGSSEAKELEGRISQLSGELRENRERMVTLLHMLLAEADRSLDGCETVCQDLLEVLLIWLVRCTTLSLQVEESPRSDNRECVEIKRYLDNNYREDISLDTLAEVAHINKYYLAHTFQKAYGISPITYLNRRRIEESKYMLGNTGYSLAQISELMGFSSPSYFSQCFRKAEGLTPNEYRRQVRQGQRPAPAKRHEG